MRVQVELSETLRVTRPGSPTSLEVPTKVVVEADVDVSFEAMTVRLSAWTSEAAPEGTGSGRSMRLVEQDAHDHLTAEQVADLRARFVRAVRCLLSGKLDGG
jgi:hypothetical protein